MLGLAALLMVASAGPVADKPCPVCHGGGGRRAIPIEISTAPLSITVTPQQASPLRAVPIGQSHRWDRRPAHRAPSTTWCTCQGGLEGPDWENVGQFHSPYPCGTFARCCHLRQGGQAGHLPVPVPSELQPRQSAPARQVGCLERSRDNQLQLHR